MIFRCPDCRTRRVSHSLFTRHVQTTGHSLCTCSGYHYAHRPRSPFCSQNPMSAVNLASRAGTPDHELADIAAAVAFHERGRVSRHCPF